jgi:DNA-nicking Smr family endonuclease
MTKKLPPDEQALWDAVVKSIKPIKHDMVVAKIPNVLKIPERPLLPTPGISRTQKVEALHANDLRNVRPEAQLDLHGFTQAAGEMAVREFLKNSLYRNLRWVRIITGKGSPNNPSILREQTPKWLQSMPEFVTGYAYAKPDDGGSGAFYVKIRRKVRI